MKLLTSSSLISLCTLSVFTSALPFSQLQEGAHIDRRKAPYSVIPVDGGQPDGVAPTETQIVTKDSTQTVTESPESLPPVTVTTLSTTVVTVSETLSTIITTITATTIPTTIQAPSQEVSPPTGLSLATVTSIFLTADTTTTITSTPSLTPYDDGKWRATYYMAAEPSSSSETVSSVTAAGSPSPPSDVESTTFFDPSSNGTYSLIPRGRNDPKPHTLITTAGATKNSTMVTTGSKPPMPTLPTASGGIINPTGVPAIDVAKKMVPGFFMRPSTRST